MIKKFPCTMTVLHDNLILPAVQMYLRLLSWVTPTVCIPPWNRWSFKYWALSLQISSVNSTYACCNFYSSYFTSHALQPQLDNHLLPTTYHLCVFQCQELKKKLRQILFTGNFPQGIVFLYLNWLSQILFTVCSLCINVNFCYCKGFLRWKITCRW